MREWIGVCLVRILASAERIMPAISRVRFWAWLGCYRKALSVFACRDLPKASFVIRALAACGRQAEADRRARAAGSLRRKRSVAVAVAAFDPALAAFLLEGGSPSPLQVAVLSATGQHSAARETLSRLRLQKKDPNFFLLQANCGELAPLVAFNKCFDFFQLSGVQSGGPEFPCNLIGQAKASSFDGSLVSVIVPAYNTEKRVGAALRSLLNQTWKNIQIIVVDDASSDGTFAEITRFAKVDARIQVLRQDINSGPYAARQKALSIARGEFVTCLDSDDWAHPERIERQVLPLLKNQRLMATVTDWVRMSDDGVFFVRKSWPLIHHNPASVMFRKQTVIDRMGGFDLVRAGADSEFYERIKVVFGMKAVRRIKGILIVGSHRPDSLMNDPKIGVSNHVLSPSRLSYWEAWRQWHIDCLRAGRLPHMPENGLRPFSAPEEILVSGGI